MDITTLFKSRLDIVRNRNKALGTMSLPSSDPGSTATSSGGTKVKSKLFPGKKTEYYAKARELVGNISNLREFLVETRAAYLNVDNSSLNLKMDSPTEAPPLSRSNSRTVIPRNLNNPPETMTNFEKDQVDMSVQKIIQNNQKRIIEFQKLIESKGIEQDLPQLYIHLGNIINSISEYLKQVTVFYAEMKAIRVKRSLDFQNISKTISTTAPSQSSSRKQSKDSFCLGSSEDQLDKSNSVLFPEDADPMSIVYSDDVDYSAEELQMFEEENSMLLQSLNTVADEVDQIESSVVQIAQLQEIFTEKVLLQDKEISQISNVVIGTTENIKGGNEQLRQAIQSTADFRAYVLFFIIIMTLSLLFLDWYND